MQSDNETEPYLATKRDDAEPATLHGGAGDRLRPAALDRGGRLERTVERAAGAALAGGALGGRAEAGEVGSRRHRGQARLGVAGVDVAQLVAGVAALTCPVRKRQKRAVKRPARPYKTAIQNRFTVGNACRGA